MIQINFPEPDFRTKKINGKEFIFDGIRKNWLLLTTEEWVRQNFVQYLIRVHHYPRALIAMEKEIQVGDLKKRFDILIYNTEHQPWMLVECKASSVVMDEETVQQVLRYHIAVPASFLLITNGHITYGWGKTGKGFIEIQQMPVWENRVIK